MSVFSPLRQSTGFWPAVAIVIAATIAAFLLVEVLVRPARRRRMALDADQGLFECAHRRS
ncbi:hypothetical protein ACX80W_00680 [Arthrobacter sp. TMN-37]